MKNFLLTSLFLFVVIFSHSQTSNWLWAKGDVGNSSSEGTTICHDGKGNIYVAGLFLDSTISFGSFALTNTGGNLNNVPADIFIVKYDVYGNVIWAKSAGGTGCDTPTAICCDNLGNVILTGEFHYERKAIFDNDTLTNTDTSGFYGDIFIAKYDSLGNVLWATAPRGNEGEQTYSITTDAAGNIFVTGVFGSSIISFGSTNLSNVVYGAGDMFIAKYDPAGNVVWAKSAGGQFEDDGFSISADVNGDVIVAGNFSSPIISFGSTSFLNSFSGLSSGIFVVKYSSSGNIVWAKSPTGWQIFPNLALTTDESGNIYLGGGFDSPSIIFGTSTLINHNWNTDLFIAKYDPSGNVLWAKSSGTLSSEEVSKMSNDFAGNIYLIGNFRDTLVFDSITINLPGLYSCFIAKYDIYGNVLCATALDSGGVFNGVTSDNQGNAYVTGYYSTSPFILGQDSLLQTGPQNVFTAKYSCAVSSSGISIYDKTSPEIFPNPSNGNFTFIFPNAKKSELRIYNSLGEIIGIWKITNEKLEIDLNNQPNGIYFYQLMNEEQNDFSSGKLVIEK